MSFPFCFVTWGLSFSSVLSAALHHHATTNLPLLASLPPDLNLPEVPHLGWQLPGAYNTSVSTPGDSIRGPTRGSAALLVTRLYSTDVSLLETAVMIKAVGTTVLFNPINSEWRSRIGYARSCSMKGFVRELVAVPKYILKPIPSAVGTLPHTVLKPRPQS